MMSDRIHRMGIAVAALLTGVSLAAQDIAIPRCDGGNFENAAVIGQFTAPGAKSESPDPTELRLEYDDECLRVYARCADPARQGRAFPRRPTSDLSQDEAFSVVIGSGEDVGGKMRFGGYEGATGELGKVRDFYEFACNRAGTPTRRYNETPLAEPLFRAEVREVDGGWEAVLDIPWAAAGIDPARQREIFFNAFRFHAGARSGWFLPGWGNFVPLPLVKARLLALDESGQRTVAPAGNPVAVIRNSPPPGGPPGVEYYPIQQAVVANFPAGRPAGTLRVLLNGRIAGETATSPDRETILRVPVNAAAGSSIRAELEWNGTRLAQIERTVPPQPLWAGTSAGKAYLADRVPAPWRAPEVKDSEVKLACGDFRFGDSALPEAIFANGNAVTDGPIRVEAVVNGHTLPVDPLESLEAYPAWCMAESAAAPGVEVKTRIEFDNFCIVRIRLNGISAADLESLTVRIPLAEGVAHYILRGSSQSLFDTEGFGYTGAGGELWVGDVAAGLSFDCDRRFFFSPAGNGQIEVAPAAGGGMELILRAVTERGQVNDPEQVFQFFLQPTPFRNDAIRQAFETFDLWFENWSDYQGYPDPAKIPEAKTRAEAAHAQGKLLQMYFSQVLAENAPGFEAYRTELVAPPDRVWYRRAYDPGKGVPCHVICFRGVGGDLLLDGVEKLADESGLDGVYLDGPTCPFDCANPAHRCADSLPAVWDDDYSGGRILGQRAFLKRLRGIFDERGRTFPLFSHTGGGMSLATLSLCDYYYDGEHLVRYRRGYLLEPEKMLICYSGAPFGFSGVFLPQLYFGTNSDNKMAMPWSLPHGISSAGSSLLQTEFFHRLRAANGVFYPYWKAQPHLIRNSKDLNLVSYWLGDGEAMIVASNPRYQGAQTVELEIGGLFPGEETLTAEALNGASEVAQRGGTLTVRVPEGECRVISVKPGTGGEKTAAVREDSAGTLSAPPPFPRVDGFRLSDWEITGGTFEPAGTGGMLKSILYGPMASMKLNAPIPGDFTLRTEVLRHGRLRIGLDGVAIRCDGGRWSVDGLSETELSRRTEINDAAPDSGQAAVLTLGYRDGLVYLNCGDESVLRCGIPAERRPVHEVSFSTWAGDEVVFGGVRLSEGFDAPPPSIHPVEQLPSSSE